jgi:hypothetical protein
VDGTDCPIQEPTKFSGRWYSHKFKGAGLRYELGISIQTGWIVWKNGPYPCWAFPDIKIARHKLVKELLPGEKYVADRVYFDGGQFADTPTGFSTLKQRMQSLVRAQHETVNSRLKKFHILSTRYRNDINTHYLIFHALCNVLQVEITQGAVLFHINYNDVNTL